jgi:hypothetical protein
MKVSVYLCPDPELTEVLSEAGIKTNDRQTEMLVDPQCIDMAYMGIDGMYINIMMDGVLFSIHYTDEIWNTLREKLEDL